MERPLPLAPASFPAALARGLGRCVLHLRSAGDLAPYRDALLRAFRQNLTFDPQCEGSRVVFLLDLARAASMTAELRSEALAVLACEADMRDHEQAIDVLAALVEEGDQGCEQALIDRFDAACWDDPIFDPLAWTEISLRGARGLLRVARKLGAASSPHERAGNGAFWRSQVEADFGKEEVECVLREAAASEPPVAAFLAALEAEAARVRPPRVVPATLDALLGEARSHAARGSRYVGPFDWAKVASEGEQRKAIALLGSSVEPWLQRMLLRALSRSALEIPCSLLLRLAEHDDEALADAAQRALAGRSEPEIRSFVERSMEQAPPRWGALRCLRSCYLPGDGARILALLPMAPTEPDELHGLGLVLLDALGGEGRGEDAIAPWRWLYERSPCSLCRRDAVQALDALGAVPPWMIEECAWDAQPELRALASELRDEPP